MKKNRTLIFRSTSDRGRGPRLRNLGQVKNGSSGQETKQHGTKKKEGGLRESQLGTAQSSCAHIKRGDSDQCLIDITTGDRFGTPCQGNNPRKPGREIKTSNINQNGKPQQMLNLYTYPNEDKRETKKPQFQLIEKEATNKKPKRHYVRKSVNMGTRRG